MHLGKNDLIVYPNYDYERSYADESRDTDGGGGGGKGAGQYVTPENVSNTLEIAGQIGQFVKAKKESGPNIRKVCRQNCKSAGGWLSKARRKCKQECKSTGGPAGAAAASAAAAAPTADDKNTGMWILVGGAVILILVIVIAVMLIRRKSAAPVATA